MKTKTSKIIMITSLLTIFFFVISMISISQIFKNDPNGNNTFKAMTSRFGENSNLQIQFSSSGVSLTDKNDSLYTDTEDRLYFSRQTHSISVQTTSSDITVNEGQSDEIEILARGDILETAKNRILETHFTENELSIKDALNNTTRNVDIQILIPKNFDKELSLNSTSGDIVISPGALKNIKIRNVSGDISIQDLKNTNVDLSSVSGDVEMGLKIPFKDISLDLETVSGSINQPFKSKGQGKTLIKIKTVSGDININ